VSWYPKREKPCQDCGKPFVGGPPARYGPCCRWKHRGRVKKYSWTPERDQLLRDRYDSRIRNRAGEIAVELGWPGWAVKRRAQELGLSVSWPADRRDWTQEEEGFLLEHAGSRHVNWMAKKLKRSLTSVVVKLKRMQISRRWREGYTLQELQLCFGTDHHVIDRWIREGKLVGRRRGTERNGTGGRDGGPADAWVFTDEDLVTFIRNHPMAFELRKVDQLWFMDLLLAGGLIQRALEAAREGEAPAA